MQDRICQVDETSCNARPDHTFGSDSEAGAYNSAVRFTLKNRRHQPDLSGPKSANSGLMHQTTALFDHFVGPSGKTVEQHTIT
jgi:hypothetical protein